ncbi:nuclear transport factor 2 family protein [Streptomyces sp. NPDC054838]
MTVSVLSTAEVIDRFNRAFIEHEAGLLADLIAEDCVMESVQPPPSGELVRGREACTAWWTAVIDDRGTQFAPQEVIVAGERATIVWSYRFGTGPDAWVRGVNVMRVTDGRIVEAIGFSKTAGEVPLAAEVVNGPGGA